MTPYLERVHRWTDGYDMSEMDLRVTLQKAYKFEICWCLTLRLSIRLPRLDQDDPSRTTMLENITSVIDLDDHDATRGWGRCILGVHPICIPPGVGWSLDIDIYQHARRQITYVEDRSTRRGLIQYARWYCLSPIVTRVIRISDTGELEGDISRLRIDIGRYGRVLRSDLGGSMTAVQDIYCIDPGVLLAISDMITDEISDRVRSCRYHARTRTITRSI